MIKNLLLIFFIITTIYANNKDFSIEVEDTLAEEFRILDITYIKEINTIRFNNTNALYSVGNNSINDEFRKSLNTFYPKYLKILLTYKDNIENIFVKGYSSSENGTTKDINDKYQLNLILSQERAENALMYLEQFLDHINITQDEKIWLHKNSTALGMSSSNLIYDKNGYEDKLKSRRLEIEVIFKEEPVEIIVETQKSDTEVAYIKTDYKIDNSKVVYLSDYVKRLLIENPTLAEKYNFLKSIKQDIKIAKAAFRPTATLNFSQTQYTQSTSDKFTDTQSKDITLRYNIFNGFKDINEENINKYNFKSNKYLKEQVESDLIYTLTEAFISIQKQKDILELAKINLNDYDQWIEKENIKFQNGMVSLKDYAKIQSRDTMQRLNYKELTREYKDSISMFKRYLDFDVKDIFYFEKLKPYSKYIKNKDIAYYDANSLSPFIKEANANIVLYKEKMKQQKVNFYPTVDLVGKSQITDENYETTSSVNSKDTYVALEARLEFYSGGGDQAKEDKTIFEYRQKMKKRDEIQRDVRYKVDLAFNKYELVLSKDELLTLLISKREDSFLGATYDYDFAKIDANGLLDVVDALYNAKKSYIENKYDMLLVQYKILNNVGVIKNYILEDWIKE